MAMTAAVTRGELIGSRATGGFALAFKADALWVGAATELVDGAAGRLNASEAGVTRVRTWRARAGRAPWPRNRTIRS